MRYLIGTKNCGLFYEIYHMSWNNSHVIICLYVDDLLIFGSNMNVIDEAKNVIRSHFDMKDLGNANFFLVIKITRHVKEFSLTSHIMLRKF